MSNRTISMTDGLYDYLLEASLREPPLLKRLREETAALPEARMQISPEQGQFMQLLARLMGARRCIEVGVFTGYSSLAMALALPADGHILACDVSEAFTSMARRYWKEAGVAGKIELVLAPANATLDARLKAGGAGTYDLAFIDADKANYGAYYERILKLLRPGGWCWWTTCSGAAGCWTRRIAVRTRWLSVLSTSCCITTSASTSRCCP